MRRYAGSRREPAAHRDDVHFPADCEQAPQQPCIAAHRHRLAVKHRCVIAGAFLCRERQQIDVLDRLQRGIGVQPARQQDFIDQGVELGDALFELGLVFWIAGILEQLESEP